MMLVSCIIINAERHSITIKKMATKLNANDLLFKALSSCLPYMQGLEGDNSHDPDCGIYQDHELTDAYNLAKQAIQVSVSEKENERRLFAAMALQGILSNQQLLVNIENIHGGPGAWAVRAVDNLLSELEK
jgi:hypothetical protein